MVKSKYIAARKFYDGVCAYFMDIRTNTFCIFYFNSIILQIRILSIS